MNKFSAYRFPERIKRIYQKHFPNDENVTYGNLIMKIDEDLGKGKNTLLITINKGNNIEIPINLELIATVEEVTNNDNT